MDIGRYRPGVTPTQGGMSGIDTISYAPGYNPNQGVTSTFADIPNIPNSGQSPIPQTVGNDFVQFQPRMLNRILNGQRNVNLRRRNPGLFSALRDARSSGDFSGITADMFQNNPRLFSKISTGAVNNPFGQDITY